MQDKGSDVRSYWITSNLYYKIGRMRKFSSPREIQLHGLQDKMCPVEVPLCGGVPILMLIMAINNEATYSVPK